MCVVYLKIKDARERSNVLLLWFGPISNGRELPRDLTFRKLCPKHFQSWAAWSLCYFSSRISLNWRGTALAP